MIDLNRILGVVMGTAIGDALGYPVEFVKDPHVTTLPRPALYSDDTQLFRAVCEGLLRAKTWLNIDKAAEEIAAEFVAWVSSPENNRSPGAACMLGAMQLSRGFQWRTSGKPDGKGSGAAMRSMAYGIWFNDPMMASFWAEQHAQMTHQDPSARASAAVVASVVSALLRGDAPVEAGALGIEAAFRVHAPTGELVKDAYGYGIAAYDEKPDIRVLQTQTMLDKCRGWLGDEAAAASLFCLMAYHDDFEGAVLAAVNGPGDSDTLGAITGSFLGAHLGIHKIRKDWQDHVEKSLELQALAGRLCVALENK